MAAIFCQPLLTGGHERSRFHPSDSHARGSLCYNGGVGNPHDEQLHLCWKICRFGAERIRQPGERAKVLAWIERMQPVFPGSPYLESWAGIIIGDARAALRELAETRTFEDLPSDRRSFWRPLIQSHPFACIVPGRTTRERRAVLSRLP